MTPRSNSFSLMDHTADTGVEVRGENFPALLEHAGEALFTVITDITKVRPASRVQVEIAPGNEEKIMRTWLDDLLSRFNTVEMLFSKFRVNVIRNRPIIGEAWGEIFDPEHHVIHTEIKGITYHQFQVTHSEDQWVARIILDV